MTFGLGAACLAVAACLLLPTYYVHPHVGNAYVLVAFTIVVLGGMGSVPGALTGGLMVGVVESLSGLSWRERRPARHFCHFHPGAAVAPERTVRGDRMRNGLLRIVVVVAALAVVPLIFTSNTVLNFLIVALMIALAGRAAIRN